MTVDDVLKGKGISVHEESDRPTITEFKDLCYQVLRRKDELQAGAARVFGYTVYRGILNRVYSIFTLKRY